MIITFCLQSWYQDSIKDLGQRLKMGCINTMNQPFDYVSIETAQDLLFSFDFVPLPLTVSLLMFLYILPSAYLFFSGLSVCLWEYHACYLMVITAISFHSNFYTGMPTLLREWDWRTSGECAIIEVAVVSPREHIPTSDLSFMRWDTSMLSYNIEDN